MAFDEYSAYYDLLYSDKDYESEARYINSLLKKYAPCTKSVLDLGCGTGRHAELLTSFGYDVHGIDMSTGMLAKAHERAKQNPHLSFSESNIQDFELQRQFDAVTALFHVMSYQTTNENVKSVFECVKKHLNVSENAGVGVFIFDVWFGPSVLWQKPELRIKRMENEKISVTRIAESNLLENDNVVEVSYDIFVKDLKNGVIKEIKELHRMRYFFVQEIMSFAQSSGFEVLDFFEFMTGRKLNRDTWGSLFVLQKK